MGPLVAIGAISIKHGFERGWGDKEHKSPGKKEVTSRKNPKSIYKNKWSALGVSTCSDASKRLVLQGWQ